MIGQNPVIFIEESPFDVSISERFFGGTLFRISIFWADQRPIFEVWTFIGHGVIIVPIFLVREIAGCTDDTLKLYSTVEKAHQAAYWI